MEEGKVETKSYLVLLLLSVIWGSSFILIKKALIAFDPYELACMRITTSALAFAPILYLNRKEVPWEKWYLFVAIGLTGTGIPAFMYFIAQTNINSAVSGLLNSLTPIWTLLIGGLFFGAIVNKSKIIGVIIGFIGAALLILLQKEGGDNKNLWYGFFVVVGTLCYGMSGNLVKFHFQKLRSVLISAASFVMISPPAIAFLIYNNTFTDFNGSSAEWYSLGALLILALVGTVIATIIFYKLIQETSAVFGSSVAYLMPIVAIIWGFFDGESIGIIVLLSMALILYGVHLIKKST